MGLLGAVAAFLSLAVVGLLSDEPQRVRAAYVAMQVIASIIVVPLAFASLVTGFVQSLGTVWGLFRHYWVLAKLVLTVLVTVILLLQMQVINYLAGAAVDAALASSDLLEARMSLVAHAAVGLLVLLLPMILSIYKPRGMTRFGRRKALADS